MSSLIASLQTILSLLTALHGNTLLSTSQQQTLNAATQNVQSLVSSVQVVSPNASVKLLSPTGGQTYQPGVQDDGVITVSWSAPGVTSADNSFGLTIYNAANKVVFSQTVGNPVSNGQVAPTGSYSWTIPSTIPRGSYLAYVSWQNSWAESAPFNISVAISALPATLAASINAGLASPQSVPAGASNIEIGSYAIAAPSTQAASVNSLNIQLNGYASYFQNLHVAVNGVPFGATQAALSNNNTYTFSGSPFIIAAGGKINLNVYADILSTAGHLVNPNGTVTAGALTALSGCAGVVSSSAVTCGPSVTGQSVTISPMLPSSLNVTLSATSPASNDLVMGSTGNPLATYQFTNVSSSEAVKITGMTIFEKTSASQSAFENLQLLSGATVLGTAAQVVPVAGGYNFAFHFSSPVVVAQGNSLSLSLQGAVVPFSLGVVQDNQNYAFQVGGTAPVTAVGVSSNVTASVTGSAVSNPMTVLRSIMTITAAPSGGSVRNAVSGADTIGMLTFRANNAGSVALNKLTITFWGNAVGSSLVSTNNIQLIDQNGNNVLAVGEATAVANSSVGTITWYFPGPNAPQPGFDVLAGSSYSFGVVVNTKLLSAPTSAAGPSLSALIKNPGDVLYTDGLTSSSTSNISILSSSLPVSINSVFYPPSQLPATTTAISNQTNQTALIFGSVQGFFGSLLNSVLGH